MRPFLRQYLVTALWSSAGPNDQPLDRDYDVEDFAPTALAQADRECAAFEAANAADLATNPELGGHDFWLTRNHHGAGFWDGDWADDVGERLTKAAQAAGERSIEVGDDGLLYFFPGA